MDPISNTDRLVLLLRQKLQERVKAAGSVRAGAKGRTGVSAPQSPTGLDAVAAIQDSDERTQRRALLQHLLADQLGPELLNDANFQEIVTRVTDAIERDAPSSRLLSRLISDLRAS